MAETEVERFWRETEERLGERVLLYSLGQYLGGYGDVRSGAWGLFYISDSALHFQTFPNQNWFSTIFRSVTRNRARDQETTEMEFTLPQASIREVQLHGERSLWKRVVAPQPPTVSVFYINEDGNESELRFLMDMKVKEFVNLLSARAP